MKLILSTFFMVFAIVTVNCAKYDAELASVLKKLKAFDLETTDQAGLEAIPLDVFMWLTFVDFDCVEEKLNIQNVDKKQVQDINNLLEFEKLNLNNKKLFVAIGNAAKACSRKSKEFKDAGIHQILSLRAFTAKLIFPDVRLNENRAEECFKWALSRIEPESRLVEGFDVNSMQNTIATCEKHTSIKSYRESLVRQMNKLDIKSCDVDKYEQPTTVGYNVMKMFLFSKVADKMPEYREELSESVIKFEADLLETQMNCILRDLRED
ncbi:hypothetical protein ACKWTF_014803 [Chironomus riparius]